MNIVYDLGYIRHHCCILIIIDHSGGSGIYIRNVIYNNSLLVIKFGTSAFGTHGICKNKGFVVLYGRAKRNTYKIVLMSFYQQAGVRTIILCHDLGILRRRIGIEKG